MAGRGPAPTDPARVRRRNKPAQLDELPAAGYSGDYPPLPVSYRNAGRRPRYLTATRDWYDTWARSPMAARFTAVEWGRLRILAALVDTYNREPRASVAGEIRLQESLLGATHADRQRMGVRIGPPEADQAPEPTKAASVRRLRAL